MIIAHTDLFTFYDETWSFSEDYVGTSSGKGLPYHFNWDLYMPMWEAGMLDCILLQDEDTLQTIGFVLVITHEELHFKSQTSHCQLIYVAPERRGLDAVTMLVDAARRVAKSKKSDTLSIGEKDRKRYTKVLSLLGFNIEERTYTQEVT